MVYVKDIMEMEYFKNNHMELVAGGNGLNRIVTRPNIAQLMSFHEWMVGGEFLLINGVGLALNEIDNMLTLIRYANKGKAACIAFEISKDYIPEIPKEAIELANELRLPIFTLPWNVPFGEILNTVYDYIVRKQMEEKNIYELMQSILFGNPNEEYTMQQAAFYGYDLTTPHFVVIADCSEMKDRETGIAYLNKCLSEQKIENDKIMSMNLNGNRVLFYPETSEDSLKSALSQMIKLQKKASRSNPISFSAGSICKDLSEYRSSYEEALQAERFLQLNPDKQIQFYEELGLLRLLDHSDHGRKMQQYVEDWLAPIKEYEDTYHIPLTETLDEFQKHNFNLTKTAESLFIHRNTLLQRLDRIYSLLNIDINDYNVRREIMNVMYLRQYRNI